MIYLKIILLLVLLLFVMKQPKLKKYSFDTKFNIYRSLMCLYFTLFSFENTINNITNGYNNPFNFKYDGFTDISTWFISYLLLDIIIMIWIKNTRWDLYLHHMWCLCSYIMAFYYDKIGFFFSFLLINEAISIVSGIDSLYMEDKELLKSKKCKLYRKYIIKYIRLPVWIIILLGSLYYINELPQLVYWNGILTSCLMIYLDKYWEKKCDKIINLNI